MARRNPLWATPDRQNLLVKLWLACGNKCLQGHSTCPIYSHYLYFETKSVEVAIPKDIPYLDRDKNPLKDNEGKPIYLTVYGSKAVTISEQKIARLYELISEAHIKDWLADDRLQRQAEWQAERQRLHKTTDRYYPLSGQFSGVGRDIFFDNQPLYYIAGFGFSCLTFTPFVKLRLSSSYVSLFVDLGDTLKRLSKARKRKAIRYGKPLPCDIEGEIDDKCKLAVRHYLKIG